jgi:hypothetical protein
MERAMKLPKEVKNRLDALEAERAVYEAEQAFRNLKSNASRARAITVGTAFGGTTEISIRGEGGDTLWCLMQPVEVIELINQLSANIGCHIHIQPRKDFSSWREWNLTEAEKLHYNGHVPFVNDMAPFNQVGVTGADQALIERLKVEGFQGVGGGKGGSLPLHAKQELLNKGEENVVATKKTVNRRSAKRASKTP